MKKQNWLREFTSLSPIPGELQDGFLPRYSNFRPPFHCRRCPFKHRFRVAVWGHARREHLGAAEVPPTSATQIQLPSTSRYAFKSRNAVQRAFIERMPMCGQPGLWRLSPGLRGEWTRRDS